MSESLLRAQLFYECRIFPKLVCPKQTRRNTRNNGYTLYLCCIQGATIVLTYIIVPWTLTRPT